MSKSVFLFSGQGSQYVGMAKELCETFPSAARIFDMAGDILGCDLKSIVFDGPDTELNKTVYSQPAIMAASLCALEAVREKGISCEAVAGHSLGEYAAMVCSGVLSPQDGFKVIKERAAAMQKAAERTDGAMYAIIGPDAAEVEKVCESTEGYVVPVNYNSAVQTVIAGETAACESAAGYFAEKKARAIKLNVPAAFHSRLMQPAADEFYEKIKDIKFSAPSDNIAFYSNVTGERLDDFSDMPGLLARHIVSPVKFTSELSALEAAGFDTFIELGPNKVLTGLVKKTLKGVNACNVENLKTLGKLTEAAGK